MTTKFKNGASDDIIGPASTLASNVAVGAVSMTVATGTGDRFPVVTAPDVAYVTLQNATKIEIVKITDRASGADTMTIVKAQEGTTDRAWVTGDVVSMRITAAQAESAVNAQAVAAAALTSHEAAADPHPGYVTTAELTAALAGEQDADSELSILAAMATARANELAALSAFIGGLLNDADAATARSTLGAAQLTSALTAVTPATGDYIHVSDVSDAGNEKKVLVSDIVTLAAPDGALRSVSIATYPTGATGNFTNVSTGTFTYAKPAGLKRVRVTLVAGGGGGAGRWTDYGNGGEAGGTSIKTIEATALSASESATVGGGGAAGYSTGNGGNGGSSSFGAHCTASGGEGGYYGMAAAPRSPGVGSSGDINMSGGYAHHSDPAAGTNYSRAGGCSYFGGGGRSTTGTGRSGTLGGGGASAGYTGTHTYGGAGGSGIIIVEEFF